MTDAGLVGAQIERLGAFACELERNLLEVQDDVGRVFDYAGDGLELVQHALDADGGDGCAFDRAEQRTSQGVADGGAEAAFKGLGAELAVSFGERLGIDCQTLWLLKSSPKHIVCLFSCRHNVAMHFAAAAQVLLQLGIRDQDRDRRSVSCQHHRHPKPLSLHISYGPGVTKLRSVIN